MTNPLNQIVYMFVFHYFVQNEPNFRLLYSDFDSS